MLGEMNGIPSESPRRIKRIPIRTTPTGRYLVIFRRSPAVMKLPAYEVASRAGAVPIPNAIMYRTLPCTLAVDREPASAA